MLLMTADEGFRPVRHGQILMYRVARIAKTRLEVVTRHPNIPGNMDKT